MKSWSELCEVTRKQLNRELKEEEEDFLKWVYDKHVLETAQSSQEPTKD